MDINKVISDLQKLNPTKRFATNAKMNAIGYWNTELNRWQLLLGKIINGDWAQMPELFVNGNPLIAEEDWIEILK